MERFTEAALLKWKESRTRTPLIIRGARQVGKTHLVKAFARKYFESAVCINLEKNPEYKTCFETLEPKEVIQKISLNCGESIQAGKTLLFIDEIQMVPEAIEALRYFKEEMSDLHVIAAGSLLEFALNAEDFKMPVGRVEYLYMKPLSFLEYLDVKNKAMWIDAIKQATPENPLPEILHQTLIREVQTFMALGGMPEVVDCYLQDGPGGDFQRLQNRIMETYIDDFAKYASMAKQAYLRKVFSQLSNLVSQQIKYSNIDPDIRSRFLKEAIECLEMAGIVYKVYASSGSGVPLSADLNFNKFKLYFLDIGLLASRGRLNAEVLTSQDVLAINRGQLAEQFVAQELMAYQPAHRMAELHYWVRNKKSSTSEVDFIVQHGEKIYPIEVKAGATGRMRSIQIFLEEKGLPLGLRVSQKPLSKGKNILSIPLYMVSEIKRLCELSN